MLSTAGDTYLGGDDFDDRIMTWLADDFLAKHGLDLRQNKFCLQMLKEARRAGEDRRRPRRRRGHPRARASARTPEGKVLDLDADAHRRTSSTGW